MGSVLVGVRVIFLPNCHLVLFLLKHRSIGAFLNKKNEDPNRESLLNSSSSVYIYVCVCNIYIYIYIYTHIIFFVEVTGKS